MLRFDKSNRDCCRNRAIRQLMGKKKFQTVLVQALLTEQQENAVGQLGKKLSFYCFNKRERVFYVFFFFVSLACQLYHATQRDETASSQEINLYSSPFLMKLLLTVHNISNPFPQQLIKLHKRYLKECFHNESYTCAKWNFAEFKITPCYK